MESASLNPHLHNIGQSSRFPWRIDPLGHWQLLFTSRGIEEHNPHGVVVDSPLNLQFEEVVSELCVSFSRASMVILAAFWRSISCMFQRSRESLALTIARRAQAPVFRHGVSEPSVVLKEYIQRQSKR